MEILTTILSSTDHCKTPLMQPETKSWINKVSIKKVVVPKVAFPTVDQVSSQAVKRTKKNIILVWLDFFLTNLQWTFLNTLLFYPNSALLKLIQQLSSHFAYSTSLIQVTSQEMIICSSHFSIRHLFLEIVTGCVMLIIPRFLSLRSNTKYQHNYPFLDLCLKHVLYPCLTTLIFIG